MTEKRLSGLNSRVPLHFDSTIWNDFKFHKMISATYIRLNNWMQQIVAQLLFNGLEES